MRGDWRLLGCRNCGSAIVEAALVLAKIDYDDELVASDAQVPTLILPDGTVMTESAAIILYIDGLVPQLGLVPPVKDPLRRDFLRWLMFLVAAVYPTFTYGDESPATDEHRQSLWRLVEGAVRGPWFLGERPSALDLYVSAMTRWQPRRDWFAENCPRLHAIAVEVDRDPRLASVWATNFS
jgi:GST-like protein